MSQKDWAVGPVLKNKPGSQGTLVRGGTKWSSDKRYPRGYTPGRRAEVDAAFTQNSYKDTVEPKTVFRPETRTSNEHYRQILDNVSRSTIPVEHLAPRVDDFNTTHPMKVMGANEAAAQLKPSEDAHYRYTPANAWGARHVEDELAVRPRYTRDHTSIHELGHHYDQLTRATGTHMGWKDVGHLGQAEAFADDYAEQHYRDKKGRPTTVETYPLIALGNAPPDFTRSYNRERAHLGLRNLSADQFHEPEMGLEAAGKVGPVDRKLF